MSPKRRMSAMISARFSPAEATEIATAAAQWGVSQSQLIRDAALVAARKAHGRRPRYPLVPVSQSVNLTLITYVSGWVE